MNIPRITRMTDKQYRELLELIEQTKREAASRGHFCILCLLIYIAFFK